MDQERVTTFITAIKLCNSKKAGEVDGRSDMQSTCMGRLQHFYFVECVEHPESSGLWQSSLIRTAGYQLE